MDSILFSKSIINVRKVTKPNIKSLDFPVLKRLVKFGFVGVLASIVFYLLLWVMVELLDIPVLIATSIAFILVIIENYILHHRWTFRSNKAHKKTFPRFVLMSILGFAINWYVMYEGVELLAINYLLVQAAAIVLVSTWNIVISHIMIFYE